MNICQVHVIMSKYFICILVGFFFVRLLIVDRPNCLFFFKSQQK